MNSRKEKGMTDLTLSQGFSKFDLKTDSYPVECISEYEKPILYRYEMSIWHPIIAEMLEVIVYFSCTMNIMEAFSHPNLFAEDILFDNSIDETGQTPEILMPNDEIDLGNRDYCWIPTQKN
ncbi:hypothetical protein QAD02_016806 [Eretmocerus hayati]|uniref:Uncharacterized protein n=1 Tax=Eretmocerus hayati TaxID=131215 RepID=A0ACC2PEM4_9HYME|nr:hypothetical protein QAD02_016806 [Eretmocerus hayati]